MKEIGITNSGTPFCLNDAPTTGPYHQLCLGANFGGNGIVSYQAYNGAPVQSLMCNINGVIIPCELSASNVQNLPGPLSVAGDITTPSSINAGGNIIAGSLVQGGTIHSVGDADVGGDLGVSGTVYTNGITDYGGLTAAFLDASGTIYTPALIQGGNITSPGLIQGQNVHSLGDADVGGNLGVSDTLYTNNLTVYGQTDVNKFLASGSASTNGGLDVAGQVPNGGGFSLVVNGDSTANSWQINSDARLKTDIEDFRPHGLAVVKQLRPVSYRFGTGPLHHGLIADEVQKIFPQAVSDYKGIKTIDPMALIDVLIVANRELAERLEALEKRVK